MYPPSEDIKDILEDDKSLTLTFGTNLFISEMPETPNACVCVYDYDGLQTITDVKGDANIYRPNVQIRIRGDKGHYRTAYNLSQDIKDLLHCKANFYIIPDPLNPAIIANYLLIACITDILFIKYDENHRPLFSLNFTIMRTQS